MKHMFFIKDESLPSCHKRITKMTEFGFIANNHEIIDLSCNLLSTPIGYKRQDLLNHTLDKIKDIPICPAEYEFDTNEVEVLSENIFKQKNVYSIFGLNGSDAIESAIKCCRTYRLLKNQKKKQNIISFDQTYHGSTDLCLRLAGLSGVVSQDKQILLASKDHILLKNANSYKTIKEFEECTLTIIEKIFNTDGSRINAIVQESISWGADFRSFSENYWNQLRDLCDKHDIFLVIDDIAISGGKTGSLFGFTVKADAFCVGKAFGGGYFPLSVCGINKKMFEVVKNSMNTCGNTFSMHLPGIVSANYYHKLLETEKLYSKIEELSLKGNLIANSLNIKAAHGTGTLICLELDKNYNTIELEQTLIENNLNLGICWNPYFQNKIFWCIPFLADNAYFEKVKTGLQKCLNQLQKS